MNFRIAIGIAASLGLASCAVAQPAAPPSAVAIARATELVKAEKFAEAQTLLEAQLATAQTERNDLQNALANMHYAWAEKLNADRDYENAIVHYLAAYETDQKLRPAYAVAELNQVGGLYAQLGRYEEALAYFQRTLPLLRASGDRVGQINALTNASGTLVTLGRLKEAEPLYEQVLALYRELNDRKNEARALMILGGLNNKIERPAETVRYAELALPILRELGDRLNEANQLNNIGLAWNDLSDYARATEYYNRALPIFREIENRAGEATTLGNLGLACDNLSRYDDALGFYNQALGIRRDLADRGGEATVLINIASVYNQQSRTREALDFYVKALAVFEELKNEPMIAITLGNSGRAFLHLGRTDEALSFFQRALETNRKIGNRGVEASTLSNIGSVYLQLDRYEEALHYFEQALEIRHQLSNRSNEGITLSNIGAVYQNLGQPEKALQLYQQALEIRIAIGDRQGEATMLNNISSIYDGLERYDEALKNSQAALAIHREIGYRKGAVAALINSAQAERGLGDLNRALEFYEEALNLTREIGERGYESDVLHGIAMTYADAGQLDRAMIFYGKALPVRREVQDRNGEAATLNNMMFVATVQKQPEMAIFYGKQAVNLTQSIRRDIRGLDKESRDSFVKTREFSYQQLARLLIGAGRFTEAEEVSRMLQQDEFLDFVRRDARGVKLETLDSDFVGAEQTVVAEQNTRVESVAKLSAEAFTLGDLEAPTPAQTARLAEVQTSLKSARAQLDEFFAAMPARFARNITDVNADRKELSAIVPLLREMGKQSNSKVALVSAFVDDKGLELLLTLPSGQTINLSYAADEKAQNGPEFPAWLNAQIFDFKNLIEKRAPVESAATALWNVVGCKGSLSAQLEGAQIDTVMWRLTGPLRAIPLAALRDKDGYLVEKYRNVVLTAGSSELNLAHQPVGDWKALGVGVTKAWNVGGDQFSALSGVEGELKAVMDAPADGFPNGVLPGRVLQDEKFSEANFFRLLRGADAEANSPWQVVHIASHFKLASDNLRSFLLTGDGKALTIADLQERAQQSPLFPGVELMTLSACDTASGGQGADSLGALAELNGARSVLATLWPVADKETAQLMADFYANHAATPTAGKAVALQNAQLKLLHGSGVAAHPYYWAPFVLMGNWR